MTQVEEVVQLAREIFGDGIVGAYLHGSALLGGLRPHSDLDVLVVLRDHTTGEQRRRLGEGLLDISGAGSGDGSVRPVEVTVVTQSEVRPWRYPPRREFQYGEWVRDEIEAGEIPSPETDPDLAALITIALMGDSPLCGPSPSEALDPVPYRDLVRSMMVAVPQLLVGLEEDTRNAVLTLARIWMTLTTGEIGSKDTAADWVLDRLPERYKPPLVRARAIYLGEDNERWDDLQTSLRPYADHVAEEIENLAAPYEIHRADPS